MIQFDYCSNGARFNHQLFVSHCQTSKSPKFMVDLEAGGPGRFTIYKQKTHTTSKTIGRNVPFFFKGNWKYLVFFGVSSWWTLTLQRLFSRHTFFHWIMIPSLYWANTWKSPFSNICLKTGWFVCLLASLKAAQFENSWHVFWGLGYDFTFSGIAAATPLRLNPWNAASTSRLAFRVPPREPGLLDSGLWWTDVWRPGRSTFGRKTKKTGWNLWEQWEVWCKMFWPRKTGWRFHNKMKVKMWYKQTFTIGLSVIQVHT